LKSLNYVIAESQNVAAVSTSCFWNSLSLFTYAWVKIFFNSSSSDIPSIIYQFSNGVLYFICEFFDMISPEFKIVSII